MGMPDGVYLGLKNVSWECFMCRVPNLSTSLFDTTIFEGSNSFSPLSDTTSPESDISFNFPNAISSPTRPVRQKLAQTRKDLPLRIAMLNCQSVKASGKPAQLKNLVSSRQADVVIGSESWLNSSIKSSEVFPDGFNAYRRDRPDGCGGGVFLLVSQQYESPQPEELTVDSNVDCEAVWVKVKVQGSSDLYIGSFYRPPDKTNPEYLQELQSIMRRIPTDKGAHLWLGGDFNLPDIIWEEESVVPYASYSSISNQLLSIAKDSFLEQIVAQPTRITETTSNILDLFFTSNPTLINKVEVIPGIGDHEAVFIESSLRPMRFVTPPRKIYKYKNADYQSMRRELRSTQADFEEKARSEDVEQLWSTFKEKIQTLMESYIPSKILRRNREHKPWISRQVKTLLRKSKKLFQRQRRTGKVRDIRHYKETKARLQKAERQSYWQFVDNIIEVGDTDQDQQLKQKRFWSYIKSIRKDTGGVAPLKENGRLNADPKDKANILNRQYESTWTQEDTHDIPSPDGEPYPPMKDVHVSTEGVTKLLQKLNPAKATGPDLLPARVLKELASEISPYLTAIFQRSFDTGYVPNDWRKANVTAIFKKGEKSRPATIDLSPSLVFVAKFRNT